MLNFEDFTDVTPDIYHKLVKERKVVFAGEGLRFANIAYDRCKDKNKCKLYRSNNFDDNHLLFAVLQ